jgi:hypothetical protein
MNSDPHERAATCREFIEDLTGQSTRRISTTNAGGIASEDLWYMVYKDEDGVIHTVKGSTEGIRRSLTQGLLGDASNIRVARSKQGPFETLFSRPEFRDVVMEATPAPLRETARLPSVPIAPIRTPVPDAAPFAPTQPPMPSAGDSSFLLPALPSVSPTDAWSPHIVLERTARTPEWVKWLVLILLASVAGAAAYFVLPLLIQLRLFW